MQPQEDAQYMEARQNRLERLYIYDGRQNPDHPWHAHYTGLKQKYDGVSRPNGEDVSA